MDIAELIETARAEPEAEQYVEQLLDAGPGALEEVLAVAGRSEQYEQALYDVIERSTDAADVPVLLQHTDSESMGVVRSVFRALVSSADGTAPSTVLAVLQDRSAMSTTRAAAAEAFYGTGDATAQAALRDVVGTESVDPSDEWPLLPVTAAMALATTGDHRGVESVAAALWSEHDTARSLALSALRIVTGPLALTWLAAAAEDGSPEVRAAVVEPLFLLGAPASVDILLDLAARDGDSDSRQDGLVRAADIVGLEVSGLDDLPFAQEEWGRRRPDCDPDTCYRFGVPIQLSDLLEEFDEVERAREGIANELRTITGIDVPSVYRRSRSSMDAVHTALGSVDFDAGGLYKWGHRQRMPRLA